MQLAECRLKAFLISISTNKHILWNGIEIYTSSMCGFWLKAIKYFVVWEEFPWIILSVKFLFTLLYHQGFSEEMFLLFPCRWCACLTFCAEFISPSVPFGRSGWISAEASKSCSSEIIIPSNCVFTCLYRLQTDNYLTNRTSISEENSRDGYII